VGSVPVVVLFPCSDGGAGLSERREQRLVQLLVAEAAVETFDEAILHRLAGGDVMPCNRDLLAPFEDGHAGHFCPVVRDDFALMALSPDTSASGVKLPNMFLLVPLLLAVAVGVILRRQKGGTERTSRLGGRSAGSWPTGPSAHQGVRSGVPATTSITLRSAHIAMKRHRIVVSRLLKKLR
jgi:hypothetical protein